MGGMCIPDDAIETPGVTENIDIDGIGKLDPTEDPLNGQGNMFGPQNAFPELQESSTDSMTTTSRPKPPPPSTMPPAINTTEKKTTKSADPAVPIDDRNALNTDEPSNDGVNSLPDEPAAEASESTEEDPSWWIWPLTCVGIGTVLCRSSNRKHLLIIFSGSVDLRMPKECFSPCTHSIPSRTNHRSRINGDKRSSSAE